MRRLVQLAGILLVAVAVLGVVSWISVAHAQSFAHHRMIPHHKMIPHVMCPDEVAVVTTTGHECLSKGSSALFFHVKEIHNNTDVIIRFFDRTVSETFKIAPGEDKTFEDDQGMVYVPLK